MGKPGWTIRLIRKYWKSPELFKDPIDAECHTRIGLHEVHFDSKGRIWGWTQEPIQISSGRLKDVKQYLQWCMEALELPIIDETDLPHEDAEPPPYD